MSSAEQIIQIIVEQLGVELERVMPESFLSEDLNASPVEIADMFSMIEKKMKIDFPKEEKKTCKTVGDIITYVQEQLNEL